MNAENTKVLLELIRSYFDKIVEPKIANLDKMIDQGFTEEALTLALCYIDAMANFYYKKGKLKQKFINTIYKYSGSKESFSKISKIFIIRIGRDPSEKNKGGVKIACYEEIKAALLKKYGRANDHRQEVNKDELIKYLKTELGSCDWQNIEANLDKFSYAAVLYERGRSSGVHDMTIETAFRSGEPSFERNEMGEDIYYNDDILCFSKELILSTLKNVHKNLRAECISEAKWPFELV
jgi:hypothetical protein